jgi:DNA-directed RNA polymerase subunit H
MATKSDHELIPVHELMSDKEVKELLETLNLTIDSLPKMLESDPQAMRLGAKSGQVIKIYRRDGKRETPYYRAVVEG